MHVFFSHSSRDKAFVRELGAHFPSWLTPWIDEDRLLFGSNLEASLRSAVKADTDFVLLFLSEEALASPWVKREVEWALDREEDADRVILLPVLLADIRARLDELGLADRLTLRLSEFTRDGTRFLAEKIVRQIGAWLAARLRDDDVLNRRTVEKKSVDKNSFHEMVDVLANNLKSTPSSWRLDVESILLRPFLYQTAMSRRGEIPLTAPQYYQTLLREIRGTKEKSVVLAVSTLSSELWSEHLSQADYANRNIEAVMKGAVIRRLFVVPERGEDQFRQLICHQADAGISVRVANGKLLAHVSDLEDFVLFETPGTARGYVSHPAIDSPSRIRSGKLVVAPELTDRMRLAFKDAWDLAIDHDDFFRAVSAKPHQIEPPGPPGISLDQRSLSRAVVSCEEAAEARGIPLSAELKTLILETSNGMVAAHLPGDAMLSLKKVKGYLESEEAYLADPETLFSMGLSAGTVSAVLDPVWSMPHLISRRVFDLDEMMTNNGTKTGYFAFDPAVLTQALNIRIGDFEKE